MEAIAEVQTNLFTPPIPSQDDYGIPSSTVRAMAQRPGGCTCFACGQHSQIYRRTITGAMAAGLIHIYRYYQCHRYDTWLQVEGYLKRCRCGSTIRGDVAKLRHWGLIEKREGDRADGSKRNGHYRITGAGMRFVKDDLAVPKYAVIYNNELRRLEGPGITIRDCLGRKFDYDELMAQDVEYV